MFQNLPKTEARGTAISGCAASLHPPDSHQPGKGYNSSLDLPGLFVRYTSPAPSPQSASARRIPPSRCGLMRHALILVTSLLLCFIPSPSSAQLPPQKTDPLAPQSASTPACSATENSCAAAAA